MKKVILLFVLFCFCNVIAISQEQTPEKSEKFFQNHIIPILGFQTLQTESEDFIFSPSINLQFMRSKKPDVETNAPDLIAIGAGYTQSYHTQGLGPDDVHQIHGCSLMGNVSKDKNSYVAMVASSGQVPFSHVKTVTGALLYTHQFLKNDNMSFVLGCGLVVGDFDLKIKDVDIYFFPLPVFSLNYKNDFFSGTVALMGPPAIQLTLFPKSMFRLKGSCGIAGIKSIRDLTFDCSLVYYPLINSKAKEMLYISAGIMNKVSSTTLRDKTKYGYQYYSAYGEISATFVTLRCGYNFDGKRLVNNEVVADMYKGLYASLQAMFMF